MNMNKSVYWECPICHVKIARCNPVDVARHKETHPSNQRAFNGGREEADEERE